MSARVSAGKLNFVVQGRGYDDDRGNSGKGDAPLFLFRCDYAAFDVTSTYLWIVTKTGNAEDVRIHKIDTSTWQEVHHAFENIDVSPNSAVGMLTYVENDDSNYGVLATAYNQTVIFDLTTDEVIDTINGNWGQMYKFAPRATRVDDVIRVIGTQMQYVEYGGNSNLAAVLNTTNHTFSMNTQSGGYTFSSFYNDTDITLNNKSYGDRQYLWGARITEGSFTKLWGRDGHYDGIKLDSFASNDNLFYPTKVGDEWKYGKYPIPPDVVTPSPITTFGEDANTIVSSPVYTRERTWASFRTSENSLVVTDMANSAKLYTGNDPSLTPKAMGDPWIICNGSDGYTYLAEYR